MKRFFFRVLKGFFVALFFVALGAVSLVYANENLVANPSLEVDGGAGAPADWAQEIAGSNDAVFSYLDSGAQDGTRSVKITMTWRTSGSADLAPAAPVSVVSRETYYFENYYRSSVETETDVEFQDADGNLSWKWLGNNPASADWKLASYSFEIPAGVVKARVYQALAAPGYLQTDNYSLSAVAAEDPIITDNVPNASMEAAGPDGGPLAWDCDNWGENAPVFTYDTSGYDGSRSLKIRLNAWESGDARCYFDHQPIDGGRHYVFTDYYKSDVATDVYVKTVTADGAVNHIWLGSPAASPDWSEFSAAVYLPEDVAEYTILHAISKAGYLSTDNYSFKTLEETAFSRGMVSITFDDGFANVYNNALPILDQYGFKTTQYIVSGAIGSQTKLDLPAMTGSQIAAMCAAGHEIGSHTVTHPRLTSLNARKLNSELSGSKNTLNAICAPVDSLAIPYGDYNDNVINAAKKYYGSVRTSDTGENALIGFDPHRIKTQYVVDTTTVAEIETWLARAAANKSWLVLLYHNVGSEYNYGYTAAVADFDRQMAAIAASGLPVLTVGQALNEIKPQLPE